MCVVGLLSFAGGGGGQGWTKYFRLAYSWGVLGIGQGLLVLSRALGTVSLSLPGQPRGTFPGSYTTLSWKQDLGSSEDQEEHASGNNMRIIVSL